MLWRINIGAVHNILRKDLTAPTSDAWLVRNWTEATTLQITMEMLVVWQYNYIRVTLLIVVHLQAF